MARKRTSSKNRRRTKFRQIKNTPTILIVCEGTMTEPNYFRKFNGYLTHFDVEGCGNSKLSLILEAMELRDQNYGKYDEVWVVFDRDIKQDNPKDKDQFFQAIQKAKKENIEAIWSNDAFELWYLLHFGYHDSATHRSSYQQLLGAKLGHRYQKSAQNLYALLLSSQKIAIRNAKKLREEHWTPEELEKQPHNANPCTMVDKLVIRLNELAKTSK